VAVCPACGKELPGQFPFCPYCTAPLIGEGREHRKTVTVVFCDVTGSTALGESTDPEALRALLARYFERMRGIVESHGGTVEKFIGDAVMAVFGVPVAHEDDALRACRAAVEMRDALPELGVQARIGVNTGEVVTGTQERLATGDAVNVAARLEQTAAPGEILIGEETLRLVSAGVEVGPVEPLELKGKAAPVPAYRLVSLLDAPRRSHASHFVGRLDELAILTEAWQGALAESRCELVTLLGEAGVGKSRLVAELLAALDGRSVHGRCLPYGEGITYWPVVEVLKQLDALPSDPAAAVSIRSLLRETDAVTSAEEIAWAFRKLLEEQAPLVVLFDDIQWGEETLLDLIEGVALLSSGAPVLILCVARPELLDRRPAWPVAVRLGPLPEEAVEELIGNEVTAELQARIAAAAGGNPLFVTEMLAMAGEGEEVEVPPTLRALLSARLDQLDPGERRVLECGAIEGEVFHRGGVQALAPDESHVTPRLAALARRELIRSNRALIAGDDGFRFRHLLIRDAAYDALPKAVRAELHERFAGWLELHGGELVELDEILGYHLEQAARYLDELGRPDPQLALRAGDRLLEAGRRALDREDVRAAAALLDRALSLTRPFRPDVDAELDLAAAFLQEPARATRIAEEAAVRAAEVGDETGAALARAMAAHYRLMVTPSAPDELEALLIDARGRLEEAEDHAGLAQVWWALGFGVANMRGRQDDWATASLQARHHSRLAGRSAPSADLGTALVCGSRPADEALEIVDRVLAETPSTWLQLNRAWLLAMLNRGAEGRRIAEEASARLRDQGDARWGEWILAEISTLAGDYEDASNRLGILCEWLETVEQLAFLESYLGQLGRTLCQLGRFDEAEQVVDRARALEEEHEPAMDPESWHSWRQVLARVYAHRGELAEAERLAREAVALSERNDSLDVQCLALWDLADVLAAAQRPDEAADALEQALNRCRRKKNLALANQVLGRLEALKAELSAAPATDL
jgi:class 3 adenylate cyclase/tetratricopeptide (TPR) repeat protein